MQLTRRSQMGWRYVAKGPQRKYYLCQEKITVFPHDSIVHFAVEMVESRGVSLLVWWECDYANWIGQARGSMILKKGEHPQHLLPEEPLEPTPIVIASALHCCTVAAVALGQVYKGSLKQWREEREAEVQAGAQVILKAVGPRA